MAPCFDSSFSNTINCNVLLTFLEKDTCRSFVSYLRGSLKRKGFTTTDLQIEPSVGESEPSQVDRDIEKSKVAVVVVSENFASSPFCQESLLKILEFHRLGFLPVLIPVFYEIDQFHAQNPASSHEIENPAEVLNWSRALFTLAGIPGTHYSNIWRGDAELISKITDDVWDFMIGSKSTDFCSLVGMDQHMHDMYKLLNLGRKDQVRCIWITGGPGIGKTELAKYVYEEIVHHFDTRIWPEDGDFQFKTWKNREWDHRARVLLVLDEYDKDSLRWLRKDIELFGPGSRIIITSRDRRYGIYDESICRLQYEYRVPGLRHREAHLLFCLHAFDQTYPSIGFEDLLFRFLKRLDNPSFIKDLGSRLYGRDRKEWESIFTKYHSTFTNDWQTRRVLNIIFEDVSSSQSSTKSHSDSLVGMDHHMQALYRLLELESDKKVRVVGIWGAGGIGKTTIATYACEEMLQQFHTNVFLQISVDHSSSFCVEEQLLSNAVQREGFAISNSKDGLDVVKSMFRNKKVMLVVDGVDNGKTLEDVHKITTWLGPGSRVIVITRDESLLVENGVKHIYQMKSLRFDEALTLFCQFTSKQISPSNRFNQLSIRAIKLVGFLPLALKVIGSMLYGKDEDEWETILQSLEENHDESKLELYAK